MSYGSPISGSTYPTYIKPSKKNKTPVTDIYSNDLNYGKYSSGNTGGTGGSGGGGGSSTTTNPVTGNQYGDVGQGSNWAPIGQESTATIVSRGGGGASEHFVNLVPATVLMKIDDAGNTAQYATSGTKYPTTSQSTVINPVTGNPYAFTGAMNFVPGTAKSTTNIKEPNTLTQATSELNTSLLAAPSSFTQEILYPTKERVNAVSPQVAALFKTGVPINQQQSFLPTSITPKIVQSPTQLRDDYLTSGSPDVRTLADFKLDTNYVPNILQKDLAGQYKENIQATTPTQVKQEFITSMPVITSPESITYKEVKTNVPIDLSKIGNWQEIPIGYEKTTSRLPTVWEALKGVGTNVINSVSPVAV